MSLILRKLKRYEEAIHAYNRFFKTVPDGSKIFTNRWFLLSESLGKLNCWKQAIDAYDKVFTVNLDDLNEHCKSAYYSTQLEIVL